MPEIQWLQEHNRVKVDKKDLSSMGGEMEEAAKKIQCCIKTEQQGCKSNFMALSGSRRTQ
jgi:hypothetical protein